MSWPDTMMYLFYSYLHLQSSVSFTFLSDCDSYIYSWDLTVWSSHLTFTGGCSVCRASRQQSSFPYLKHLLCLVLMTTALWLTSPSWWSVLRNQFSSTSNTTSLQAWTLTGMLSETTDPQRTGELYCEVCWHHHHHDKKLRAFLSWGNQLFCRVAHRKQATAKHYQNQRKK